MLSVYKEKLAKNSQIYLKIKVIPGAPKSEFRGEMADGTLKIAITAAPEKGRANQELARFLSAELGIRKEQIEITAGLTDKVKRIRITL